MISIIIWFIISDRKDCKWDVFDAQDKHVDGATAIYNNSKRYIEMKGEDITFEKVYSLGKNYTGHSLSDQNTISEMPLGFQIRVG